MDISQVYVSIRTSILFLFTCEGTLSVLTITISLTEKNILTPQATNFNCLSGRLKHQWVPHSLGYSKLWKPLSKSWQQAPQPHTYWKPTRQRKRSQYICKKFYPGIQSQYKENLPSSQPVCFRIRRAQQTSHTKQHSKQQELNGQDHHRDLQVKRHIGNSSPHLLSLFPGNDWFVTWWDLKKSHQNGRN